MKVGAGAWWLKDILKSECPQVNSIPRRTEGCSEARSVQERCLGAGGQSCRASSDRSRPEIKGLRQISCRELLQPESGGVQQGAVAWKLPASQLLLDLDKFVVCWGLHLPCAKCLAGLISYARCHRAMDACLPAIATSCGARGILPCVRGACANSALLTASLW